MFLPQKHFYFLNNVIVKMLYYNKLSILFIKNEDKMPDL